MQCHINTWIFLGSFQIIIISTYTDICEMITRMWCTLAKNN